MKSGLIVLPTGMGKTFTFTQIAREWTKRTGKSALVLAHRTELIGQAKRTFERLGESDVGVEMANLRVGRYSRMPRIVIASVQTLKSKQRLEKFDPHAFSLLVTDEAHHAPADSYRRILHHFDQNPDIAHIGVTATPDRADETALGCVFGQVLYKIEILDAINDGWLVPVEQQIVQVDDLDFSKVRVRTGDLAANEVESIMKKEGALHGVADATIKLAGDRKTIVFAAGVEHGKMLRDIFLRHRADSAVWIDGETPAELRSLYIEDFAANRFQILVNCDVCTEGFDDPSIECVVNAAPTKSRAKYCLDSETEALTPNGWRLGKDLSIGDVIASFDPATGGVKWEAIQGHVYRGLLEGERMMHADGPSVDVRVTDSHRMVYSSAKRPKTWQIAVAGSLPHLHSFKIPTAGRMQFAGVPLTDDELRFIALATTDGTISRANGQIHLMHNVNSPFVDEFERVIVGCGFKFGRYDITSPTNFGERKNPLRRWYISRGKPRGTDKHLRGWASLAPFLPKVEGDAAWDALSEMTDRQFAVFAEAMHVGHGQKQAGQSWTPGSFHVSLSGEFADRLQRLAVVRGWRASVADRPGYEDGSEQVVHLKSTPWITVGGFDCTRTRLAYTDATDGEMVWCVSVPSGAFLSRRRGKVAVVGNTQRVGRGLRTEDKLLDSMHDASPAERRAAIAASSKPACLVLDFAGDSGRHKLVTTADMLGGNMPPEVIEIAEELAKSGAGERNMAELLALAGEEHERQKAALRADQERASKEAERLRGMTGEATFRTYEVDPFNKGEKFRLKVRDDGPTKNLAAQLVRLGLKPKRIEQLDAGEAGKLFRFWSDQRASGMCTYKQAGVLRGAGWSLADAARLTKAQATEHVSKIIGERKGS